MSDQEQANPAARPERDPRDPSRTQEPLFTLRVLTELDETYGVYVSRCLETGHVVTADDKTTASSMMQELLQDEITYAVEHQNFPNLFSEPSFP